MLAPHVAFACEEPCGLRPHWRAARRDAGSTARLVSSRRSGSRGANLLPPSGRETIRAANYTDAASEKGRPNGRPRRGCGRSPAPARRRRRGEHARAGEQETGPSPGPAPSRPARSPRAPSSLPSAAAPRMSKVFIPLKRRVVFAELFAGRRQEFPQHARVLVSERDVRLVEPASLDQLSHPSTALILFRPVMMDDATRAVHQEHPQIFVTGLADAEQLRLAPGRVLPGHKPQVSHGVTLLPFLNRCGSLTDAMRAVATSGPTPGTVAAVDRLDAM